MSKLKELSEFRSPHPPPRSDSYLDDLTDVLLQIEKPPDVEYEKLLNSLIAKAYRDDIALKSPQATEAVLREATTASGLLRGTYVSLMRDSALTFLKGHSAYRDLCRVPVAMLPTGLMNGQACFNPSHEPLILIDSGMMRELTELMHAYCGFSTWGFGDLAHCRDHSQLDFAQTIAMLSAVVLMNDPSLKGLCPARLTECPSVRPNSQQMEKLVVYASILRDFVLLHEYGHIALGHLDKFQSVSLNIGPTVVEGFVARHDEEHEADAFAIRAIGSMRDKLANDVSLDHAVWVLGEPIGVLLRFWDLMDAGVRKLGGRLPDSHPSAISRWRRIRSALTPGTVKKDFLSDVDGAFDTILDRYQLEPASTR